jgi:hypothetical protein
VQHLHERFHVLKHLVLNIHLPWTVTRKGESCLGDNPILDEGLDLRDESQSRQSKKHRANRRDSDQLAVLSFFIVISALQELR